MWNVDLRMSGFWVCVGPEPGRCWEGVRGVREGFVLLRFGLKILGVGIESSSHGLDMCRIGGRGFQVFLGWYRGVWDRRRGGSLFWVKVLVVVRCYKEFPHFRFFRYG